MTINPKLDTDLLKRLEELSKETKRSINFYVNEAVRYYIEDLEDFYAGLSVLKNPGKLFSLEEIEKLTK